MGPNDSREVIGRVTETRYSPCEGFSFNIAVPRKGGKMEELRKVLLGTETTLKWGLYSDTDIARVIFHGPATIVYWMDGTKTVVKCMEGEKFDYEKGLAMAVCKRIYGTRFHEIFKEWCHD